MSTASRISKIQEKINSLNLVNENSKIQIA